MRSAGPRIRLALLLGGVLAGMAPAAASAQAQSDVARGLTGPAAGSLPPPAFAQPSAGLSQPRAPASTGALTSDSAGGLTGIRVATEGTPGDARPPEGWQPALDPGAAFQLDYEPGQMLDEVWVRRQFERNGLPGSDGAVGRALALVQVINRAYLSAGFINSGLVVRPSDNSSVLELRIIYGALVGPADGTAAIDVTWSGRGARGLTPGYIVDRMPAARQRPLNAFELERAFRVLAEDPAIRTINADLRPGVRPGEASLALSILPQDRFDLYVSAANNRSPSVGGERLAVGGSVRNLLGAGDLLGGEVGVTDGVEDVSASYARPFLSSRNTLSIRGALNQAAVVDPLLQPLKIGARDRYVEAGLTHRLIETPLLPRAQGGWSSARTLSVGGSVIWRVSRSTLLGEPFSFAPGAVDGRSEYAALRLVGDFLVRNVDQVFAVSLTGTLGLDGARSDAVGAQSPSQHFQAVLAQVNYARRLSDKGLELRARLTGQWSGSLLYSGERIAAGGATTVRGYRENVLLADQGVIGSLELLHPLRLSQRRGGGRGFDWGAFTVSAFADGAALRNHEAPQPQHTIFSVGGALAWTPTDALSAQVTYGHDLKYVEPPGEKNLQDRGLHVRMTVYPLRLFR